MISQENSCVFETAFDVSEHLPPLGRETIFGSSKPLTLDIGCGEGEFVCELCSLMPDFNHIGIEVKSGRFKKAVRAARSKNLNNLRLIHIDAQVALGLFAPRIFERIYINFPDPWPKDRHRKHRIITADFAALLRRAVKPGGTLEVASDHEEYIANAAEILDAAEFKILPRGLSRPTGRPQTMFEKMFGEKGTAIRYLILEAPGD